jgi:hypothetical protein
MKIPWLLIPRRASSFARSRVIPHREFAKSVNALAWLARPLQIVPLSLQNAAKYGTMPWPKQATRVVSPDALGQSGSSLEYRVVFTERVASAAPLFSLPLLPGGRP